MYLAKINCEEVNELDRCATTMGICGGRDELSASIITRMLAVQKILSSIFDGNLLY